MNLSDIKNQEQRILRHTKSFKIRKNLMDSIMLLKDYGTFNENYTKFIPYSEFVA